MNLLHKKILVTCYLLLVTCYSLTGCTTLDIARREEVAQVRTSISEELIGVKEDIRSLNGRIEELQQKIDRLSQTQSQQADELNATLKEWRTQTRNDVEKSVANIKRQLQTLEKKEKQDKKELQKKLDVILEEVTKENKELRRQIEALRKTTAYTGTEGYCVVAQGDTLSGIAQMFGVSVQSILEVNNISDPNTIRIGQKLIIPERKR